MYVHDSSISPSVMRSSPFLLYACGCSGHTASASFGERTMAAAVPAVLSSHGPLRSGSGPPPSPLHQAAAAAAG